ncbi:MAG: pseudouridine-5'-phosphate glycosidase [Gammaproteobacteria bacterium]|nr:pseudouridine-5'-phosphate glycosidase [Gammaproteobacteria bacterium]
MKMIINEEVKNALENNIPVVSLESTIISHGMPYPKNVECALSLEKIIRDNGCIPATIAIIDGVIRVGLSKEDIEVIGNGKREVVKVSKRDLPIVLARKQCGATTVSATMYISKLAGIKVFGTGGIGGVHRDYKETLDISNDLETLGEDEVVVVCAGCKSILDIPNTLEYLETKGVPVIGYKTLDCPAFYTRKSGYSLEYSSDSPKEIADIALNKWDLNLKGGVLVFNPIDESDSFPKEKIDVAIDEALKEAKEQNITGKRITPFLLKRIVELTDGKSLESNISLVRNNVRLASLIAKEIV